LFPVSKEHHVKSDLWLTDIEDRLARQFRFLLEIDRLKQVTRGSRIADASRKENTAEHSWHIATFATVLSEWAVGEVSVSRVVQMLLIHDIVEIDAGDTPLFAQDSEAAHVDVERKAAARIFGLLPVDQARHFHDLWEEFEAAESADARFAKAIDRLQPILLNHVVGGGTWTDYDIDESRERSKTERIADGSPVLWSAAESIFADAVANGWLKPGTTHHSG
jgi:putative hydrolase of HD superfamily